MSDEKSAVIEQISEEQLKAAEKYIEEDEGATNRLGGWVGSAVTWLAIGVTLFHLYAAAAGAWPFQWAPVVPTYLLRPIHVGMILFLAYPAVPDAAAAAQSRDAARRGSWPSPVPPSSPTSSGRVTSSATGPSRPTGSTSSSV